MRLACAGGGYYECKVPRTPAACARALLLYRGLVLPCDQDGVVTPPSWHPQKVPRLGCMELPAGAAAWSLGLEARRPCFALQPAWALYRVAAAVMRSGDCKDRPGSDGGVGHLPA